MSIDNDTGIMEIELFPIVEKFVKTHRRLKAIMGPVGSGKSVGCLVLLLIYAMCIKKCKDGIRRTRFLVVRNTKKELKDTTVRTLLDWLGSLGTYKETDMNFYMKFNDVECEIQFIALDDAKDTKKLLSLECSGIYFNELREIDKEVWMTAQQRIGRYPSKKLNAAGCVFDKEMAKKFGLNLDYDDPDEIQLECMWADTNPPIVGSYFHKLFEKNLFDDEGNDENPKSFELFRQPGGLDKNAENRENLPKNYYENIIKDSTKEKSDVMVHCRYGLSEAGLGIYRSYFKREEHVEFDLLRNNYSRDSKIILGMDFGLTPACVLGQYIDGVLYIYKDFITKKTNQRGLEEFLRVEVIPFIKKNLKHHRLNGIDIMVCGDPAGQQRDTVKGRPLFNTLRDFGFYVRLDQSKNANRLQPRIESVQKMLMKNKKSEKTQFLIDNSCEFTIDGFQGNYYYEKEKDGFKNEPVKNDYSHVHDAVQYLCKHIIEHSNRYLDMNKFFIHNEYSPVDSKIGY